MTSLLEIILAPGGLSLRLQPIYELEEAGSRRVHALECLVRGPAGTNVEGADVLFDYVRRKREEQRVDRVCIATAFKAMPELPAQTVFAVNVHASTLSQDPGFVEWLLTKSPVDPGRLIVEIVEHTAISDRRLFLRSLEILRAQGVRIALDDVGAGQSNYTMILDCRPDYFKLDRYLVASCHGDPLRRAIIECNADLARKFGAVVVAEGIEDLRDLDTIYRLGVRLAQGYALCMPATTAQIREHVFGASPRLEAVPQRRLPVSVPAGRA